MEDQVLDASSASMRSEGRAYSTVAGVLIDALPELRRRSAATATKRSANAQAVAVLMDRPPAAPPSRIVAYNRARAQAAGALNIVAENLPGLFYCERQRRQRVAQYERSRTGAIPIK